MSMNTNKVTKATLWSSVGIFGRQGIVFIIGVFLARILGPEQFGLIAMIAVFSNLGQLFLNFGFSQALIQHSNTSQEDLSTVFFFNLTMGFGFGSLLYLGSYPIANFYSQPELVRLIQFVSLIFVFHAFSIIQRVLLLKKIDFKSETTVIILSSLISGSIAIFLAYRGFGVWALAVKIVLQSFSESFLLWLINNWRPTLIFKISSLRKFLRFALNMFGAGILNNLTQNIDNLIIGKLFAVAQLGFFERSKHFNSLAHRNLGAVFSRVMFPVLSDLQDDNERFIDVYRKTIRMVSFLVTPLFAGLIVIAKPLIVLLIGVKWLPSVKLLQILAISGFAYPLSAIMVNAIAAKGRADIFLKLDIVKSTLGIIGIFVGSLWGIMGIVTAITITGYIGFYINIHVISKLLPISVTEQFKDMAIPIILSTLMLFLLFTISNLNNMNLINELLILPLIGTTFYLITNSIFNRKTFFEIKGIALNLRA